MYRRSLPLPKGSARTVSYFMHEPADEPGGRPRPRPLLTCCVLRPDSQTGQGAAPLGAAAAATAAATAAAPHAAAAVSTTSIAAVATASLAASASARLARRLAI